MPDVAWTCAPGNRLSSSAVPNQWSPWPWVAKTWRRRLPLRATQSATSWIWKSRNGGSTSTASSAPDTNVIDTGEEMIGSPVGSVWPRSRLASAVTSTS
nr:hypothetical protein [Amycolatopsis sp. FDAARGOS 1241]